MGGLLFGVMVVFVEEIQNEVVVNYGDDSLVGHFFILGVEMFFHYSKKRNY